MRRSVCIILSILCFTTSISGCAGTPAAEQETPLLAQSQEHTPEPVLDQHALQTAETVNTPVPETAAPKVESEQISFVTPTPEPTEAPTPTPKPTEAPLPTDTPEPNPYTGVWTIEDLPFSLELRSDKTYLVTASGRILLTTIASSLISETAGPWKCGIMRTSIHSKWMISN